MPTTERMAKLTILRWTCSNKIVWSAFGWGIARERQKTQLGTPNETQSFLAAVIAINLI
jgi:hypothetical protein